MAATSSDWENFPSYFELIKGIREFIYNTYRETFIDQREPQPIELTWRYYNFTTCDILFVLFLAVVWTVLRHIATKNVFKPLAQHYGLTPTNQGKMPESAWKFFYYLSAWCYTSYVVILSGDYKFFQKPSTVWDGWNLDDSPPFNIYFIYMAQCGFYLHSLYATVFLDTWRKDSLVMMIHHVLTLALISFSYSLRYHNIGTLVLFTHDICDIFLEFTKLNVYFKIQGNRIIKKHELFANISFFCFTVAWYVARLYWYPLRVLYTATSDVQRLQLLLPCALLMNSLLWILQLLNIYWFFFIVQFLFRVATGQVKEVDDTREYDVEEKLLGRKIYSSETIICQNGNSTMLFHDKLLLK
ncbi:ceramide synthase 1 isoform X2 [Parasteatoda tepidariorum]|uniref:ceramide synthase 1 isoform X2 n=1 Tax=Parasteatoda tepidariorum TaxID=114398 RepID=UPI001C7227E1|nr:ceramide synthase 1 isoform X2 [Parasteatoda tepidariorum]